MAIPFDFPASPTVGQKWPSPPISGVPTYMWNGVAWTTLGATTAPPGGGSFTGLPEAPIDAKQYARKNAAWAEVAIPTNLVADAPADGRVFGRKDTTWVELIGGGSSAGVGEAPIDNVAYNRKNGAWAADSGGSGGVGEAPVNGVSYVRRNAAWVPETVTAVVAADGTGMVPGTMINGLGGSYAAMMMEIEQLKARLEVLEAASAE